MAKFGPSQKEYQFRLALSLFAFCILIIGLWRMESFGPGALETVIFGGSFVVGSAIWSGWKLYKRDFGED